jgi:broad specificity phosphatase PhoE
MKWPTQLVLVRHAESAYNILREKKAQDPEYQEFKRLYEENFESPKTRKLAVIMHDRYSLGVSDAKTPITEAGSTMALTTGMLISAEIELPDVVFVSPYLRTEETFSQMKSGWPELKGVKMVPEDRIREQEHGLSLLYNDWRIFHVMYPEQRKLHELLGPYWYQYPQGESVSLVRDRIRSFLGTLVREYSGKRVMLVTHHLTLLSMRAILERLSPEEFIRLDEEDKPVNCGVTIYTGYPDKGRDGKLILTTYNKKLY